MTKQTTTSKRLKWIFYSAAGLATVLLFAAVEGPKLPPYAGD